MIPIRRGHVFWPAFCAALLLLGPLTAAPPGLWGDAPVITTTARVLPAPRIHEGIASYYGKWFSGRRMANGKRFDYLAPTVASRDFPLGTRLRVTNTLNNRACDVTVTDRGPYIPGRIIDVSYGVAKCLDMVQAGLAWVRIEKRS